MVKKLMKYDFLAYLRSLIPMDLVLLGIAILTRLEQFFENQSTSYRIMIISSVVALVIASIVALVMTAVLCISRFYRNLFSAEGYLSLTLPVTHSQHILSKTISSILISIVTCLSVLISWSVASAGELFAEICKAGSYLFSLAFSRFGTGHVILWVLEAVLLFIAVTAAFYLMMYACLTIGQLAKKNRILAAVGVFFGYYIFNQILGTVMIIVWVSSPHLAERVRQLFTDLKIAAVDFTMCCSHAKSPLESVGQPQILRP